MIVIAIKKLDFHIAIPVEYRLFRPLNWTARDLFRDDSQVNSVTCDKIASHMSSPYVEISITLYWHIDILFHTFYEWLIRSLSDSY